VAKEPDKKPEKEAPKGKREPEAPPPAEPTEAPAKPKRSFTKWGMIAGIILLQVVAAYFLQKALFFGGDVVAKEKPHHVSTKADDKKAAEMEVVMLDEIVINPADTGGRRYLAVTLGLQVGAPDAAKTIDKSKPLIRDALITVLSAKHLDQLANVAYRDTLRAEIKDAVNRQLHGLTVDNIVFSGYVLQ
jgi:flagellar basal body-associated protein FliL